MRQQATAVLALEDGTIIRAKAFGAEATVVGESVFNTSMTGYQEVLTDPSYFGQIVAMTAPQIGNTGICHADNEHAFPQVRGFVVRELSAVTSSWRCDLPLPEWLQQYGVAAIEGVDTRALTKRLRTAGALKACLSTEGLSDAEALERARSWTGLQGADYVKEVTTKDIYKWDPEQLQSAPFTVTGTRLRPAELQREPFHVVALDLGAKRNIFRRLAYHGFRVTVVPATTAFEAIREHQPDGIFLSNGPGDPSAVDYVHKTVARLIEHYPTFGICMGNQMLTHALGAQTYKLKFGHRGANQPVKNLETGKVAITSQNHGFAARKEDLEQCGAIVTEINLNDGTVEGLRHKDLPVFSVQYHPEAAPGPNDADHLFSDFYELVARSRGVTV
jgi:carbamoyl-phosphate synthase small subunit